MPSVGKAVPRNAPGAGSAPAIAAAGPARYRDWDRLLYLGAAVFLLFLYSRSCFFHSGLYWDLLMGREFPAGSPWMLSPEKISYLISQTSASLLGLKAIHHVFFFLLCAILTLMVFKAEEVIPGLIVLAVFAFSIQPLISLRDMVQGLLILSMINSFHERRFRGAYGVILLPLTALFCILGLATWLLLMLVTCQVLFRRGHSLTQLMFVVIGMLLFVGSGPVAIVGIKPLSAMFANPETVKLLSLLAGIFLIPNVLSLPRLCERRLPDVIFYVITGFACLLDHFYMPVFIVVGLILLLETLGGLPSLSINATFSGILVLIVILHLFLVLSPYGFRLNPQIRGEIGPALGPLLTGQVRSLEVLPHEVGELAWKQVVTITEDDFPSLKRLSRFWVSENLGTYGLSETDPASGTAPVGPGTPPPLDRNTQ